MHLDMVGEVKIGMVVMAEGFEKSWFCRQNLLCNMAVWDVNFGLNSRLSLKVYHTASHIYTVKTRNAVAILEQAKRNQINRGGDG